MESRYASGVELLGPTRPDRQWQARERTGFAAEHFRIDRERRQALRPEGSPSRSWTPRTDNRQNEVIRIKCSAKDCGHCPSRPQCCRSTKRSPGRTRSVRPQEQYERLRTARLREATAAFVGTYAGRAGIEGTLSRGVRRCRLRRTRYVGQERAHLGHILTAAGLNFVRLGAWFAELPRAKPRRSPFARLLRERAAA